MSKSVAIAAPDTGSKASVGTGKKSGDANRKSGGASGKSTGSSAATTDVDKWLEMLQRCELMKESELKSLCAKAREILSAESNVHPVNAPVTIVGDIHGQFWDLKEMFKVGGDAPDTNYLFLGDYVDRGHHSVECFLLCLLLKVRYPDRVTMLRGNHESREVTQVYGFYDEAVKKFGGINGWKIMCDTFDCLTLSAVVDGKVFGCHGGLSPIAKTLDQIRVIPRFREVPPDGPFADLMWSDPEDVPAWKPSPRGAGHLFGANEVTVFNQTNGTNFITRAHQLVMEGYKYDFEERVVTLWTAPNYCYRCGNVAAILSLDEHHTREFILFDAAPQDSKGLIKRKTQAEYFL